MLTNPPLPFSVRFGNARLVELSDIENHRSRAELEASIDYIKNAPKDAGSVALIVVRPEQGQRRTPNSVHISNRHGVAGDRWSKGSWVETEDGEPHPSVQVNLMGVRAAEAIAGDIENWPGAGNNFYVDIDMSPENLPPGTRLSLGSAEIEISEQNNKGCQKFIDRYGRDACTFVNFGEGWANRARGLYARVVKDGDVALGDVLRKLHN